MARTFGKHRKRREAAIPTDSFADIAFLLIIFFILASALTVTQGFIAELPQARKTEESPEKTATVRLANGKITLNDDEVTLADLRAKLAAMDLAKAIGNDRIVMFEQSGNDNWQAFYRVWAVISAAGGEVVIVLEEGAE